MDKEAGAESSLFKDIGEKRFFPFFAIIAASFFTYYEVHTFEYCYDDFFSILPIQGLENLSTIIRYFTEPVYFLDPESRTMQPLSYYRPIATSTLTLDFFLFGRENPGWLHVENLLLHTLNACIFFMICRELLGKALPAATAACLYAVFPLITEIVSIYHYRVDLVATLFIFLTLLATLKNTGKNWQWQVGVLFLCAMLSKEASISLLMLIPLFRHFQHEFPRPAELFISLGIPMLLYWPLRYMALGAFLHPKTDYVIDKHLESFSTGERLIYVLEGFWQKCLFMLNPYLISPKVLVMLDSSHLTALIGAFLIGALVVAAFMYLKRKELTFMLSAAIMISWFPVSSILLPLPDFISPRLFYYPSPWIVLLILILLMRIPLQSLKIAVIALLFLSWTSASYLQKTWNKNNRTKSLGILSFYPYHLNTLIVAGEEFYKIGNYWEASRHYNNAIVVMQAGEGGLKHKKALSTLYALSNSYIRLNNLEQAQTVLGAALSHYPKEAVFYFLAATIYLQKGEVEKADAIIKDGLGKAGNTGDLQQEYEKAKVTTRPLHQKPASNERD